MFRPILAPNVDPMGYPNFFNDLKYPLLVSPKLDGIRSANRTGEMLSRSLKVLPNLQMQEAFSIHTIGLDGELIDGEPTDHDVYNRTQSIITSIHKDASNVSFHVFDCVLDGILQLGFQERHTAAIEIVQQINTVFPDVKIQIVPHEIVHNLEELLAFESKCLELGYEGIMGRSLEGRYKTNSRCTWKEGIIFKLKRFKDEEGVIVDFVERMENTNEKQTNELGRSFRSDTKDAKLPLGMIGKFIVSTDSYGLIEVGPGKFKHAQLKEMFDNWDNPLNTVKGQFLKYRHFAHGMKDKPRFPRAIGLRDIMDL